jgi:Uma2 family endonuclease
VSSHPERQPWISPEEYLALERKAERKSQYLNGEILAMAGASREHNLVVGNLVGELGNQLRRGPCEVYPSDMRVRVSATGLYTYPDLSVVCGAPEMEDEHLDTLLNPTLLIEVLSRSTENDDRGWRSEHYRRIPSLQEYLLVAQGEARAERYRRQGDREWLLTEVVGLDESVELTSVGCRLALVDVYERVLPAAE